MIINDIFNIHTQADKDVIPSQQNLPKPDKQNTTFRLEIETEDEIYNYDFSMPRYLDRRDVEEICKMIRTAIGTISRIPIEETIEIAMEEIDEDTWISTTHEEDKND